MSQHSGQMPKQTKSGVWSAEEDTLLAEWQRKLGNKWAEVARHIPGKTGQQCAQRWRHRVNPDIRREKWAPEEDAKLAVLVDRHGNSWAVIARSMPGRTDQQCMGRWKRHLDPSIRRESWAPEEDALLCKLAAEHENAWSMVSRGLSGRTSQQCRTRWHYIAANPHVLEASKTALAAMKLAAATAHMQDTKVVPGKRKRGRPPGSKNSAPPGGGSAVPPPKRSAPAPGRRPGRPPRKRAAFPGSHGGGGGSGGGGITESEIEEEEEEEEEEEAPFRVVSNGGAGVGGGDAGAWARPAPAAAPQAHKAAPPQRRRRSAFGLRDSEDEEDGEESGSDEDYVPSPAGGNAARAPRYPQMHQLPPVVAAAIAGGGNAVAGSIRSLGRSAEEAVLAFCGFAPVRDHSMSDEESDEGEREAAAAARAGGGGGNNGSQEHALPRQHAATAAEGDDGDGLLMLPGSSRSAEARDALGDAPLSPALFSPALTPPWSRRKRPNPQRLAAFGPAVPSDAPTSAPRAGGGLFASPRASPAVHGTPLAPRRPGSVSGGGLMGGAPIPLPSPGILGLLNSPMLVNGGSPGGHMRGGGDAPGGGGGLEMDLEGAAGGAAFPSSPPPPVFKGLVTPEWARHAAAVSAAAEEVEARRLSIASVARRLDVDSVAVAAMAGGGGGGSDSGAAAGVGGSGRRDSLITTVAGASQNAANAAVAAAATPVEYGTIVPNGLGSPGAAAMGRGRRDSSPVSVSVVSLSANGGIQAPPASVVGPVAVTAAAFSPVGTVFSPPASASAAAAAATPRFFPTAAGAGMLLSDTPSHSRSILAATLQRTVGTGVLPTPVAFFPSLGGLATPVDATHMEAVAAAPHRGQPTLTGRGKKDAAAAAAAAARAMPPPSSVPSAAPPAPLAAPLSSTDLRMNLHSLLEKV